MADADMSRESIRRVKKRIEDELLALPNVHAVDIGEKITDGKPTGKLSIVVYVDEKKDVAAKNTVPEEVEGVVTDVQQEEPDVLHPALVRVAEDERLIDTTRYATLEGGMSMGPCRSIWMEPPDVDEAGWYITVGTLGAVVRDKITNDLMALTNFHVAAVDDTWSVGDDMAQPARNDGGSCPADRFGALQRGVLSQNVDGAVVSIDDRPALCEILEIGQVAGTKAASEGMAVRKRGRTTELTHGEVISVDYTTTIPYGDGLGSVTLVDQVRIAVKSPSTMFGTNGDSGSVVVDDDRNVIGLYFAGNSSGTRGVANPIAKVLSELNIEMCTPKLIEKLPKELVKELKPERFEKHVWKEWIKWEKEKFEKEKPEKELWEKLDIEGGKGLVEGKDQVEKGQFEKGQVEKGQVEKGQVEKGQVEKGLEQPPGKTAEFQPPAGIRAGVSWFGPRDPFASPLKNFFDKPFPDVLKDFHKDDKDSKDDKPEFKEWKNEHKEDKDHKDHKDHKDGKDKETFFDAPPGGGMIARGGFGGPAGPGWGGGYMGAAGLSGGGSPWAAGGYHFIPRHLRPDLSRGALRNERY